MSEDKGSAGGRLLTFTAWAVLVLGLWLWGRQLTVAPAPPAGQAGGSVGPGLPAAHAPLAAAPPQRVDVPSIGIQAPVISRDLDKDGPSSRPRTTSRARWAGGAGEPSRERPGRR